MPTKDEMRNFAMAIEELVSGTDYTYMEAIVHYCKETELEIEVAATLVNQNLKAKIQSEAMKLNMLKDKSATLPL